MATFVPEVTVPNTVTDLTNTKWLFKDDGQITIGTVDVSYNINFKSNNIDYSSIRIAGIAGKPESELVLLYYGVTSAYRINKKITSNVWIDQSYRTIEITGGTDATNRELINWLEYNATKQVYETFPLKEIAFAESVPIKTSDLANDSGFTTKTYVDSEVAKKADKTYVDSELGKKANTTDLANKQDKLVSGTNIKKINDTSILGSGNIEIKGGGITPVETLPTPTKEEYDKHELYLQDVDLNYAIENSMVISKIGDNNIYRGTTALTISENSIIIVGQDERDGPFIREYSPQNDTITTLSTYVSPGKGAYSELMAAYANNSIFIFGGTDNSFGESPLNRILRYDVLNKSLFNLSVTLPFGPRLSAAVGVYGDYIYIYGGSNNDGYNNDTYYSNACRFNFKNNTIENITTTLPRSMEAEGYAQVGDILYIFGGRSANKEYYNSITIIDLRRQLVETSSTILPYSVCSSYCVPIGTDIYICGGQGYVNGSFIEYDTILKYDTLTNTIITETLKLPTARLDGAASSIGNYAYLFGGYADNYGGIVNLKFNSTYYDFTKLAKKTDLTTKTSDLTNDSNFTNKTYVDTQDSDLQAQINAIKGGYRSIVNTKSALDSLDKSKYNTNDIVKVISDETRNNTSTYYQLSSSKVWTYIATDTDKGTIVTVGGVEQASWSADNKVDKVTGKGLSTNDYTNEDKLQIAHIADKADKATTYSKTETDSAIASAIGTALITEV